MWNSSMATAPLVFADPWRRPLACLGVDIIEMQGVGFPAKTATALTCALALPSLFFPPTFPSWDRRG